MTCRRHNYELLQDGELPLGPTGEFNTAVEHRCTSVLVWPVGETATRENTLVTDPCFTEEGFCRTVEQLERLNLDISQIGHLFVTHLHLDHAPQVPPGHRPPSFASFRPATPGPLAGITTVACPGHMPELEALVFRSAGDDWVWITGDAVLNLEWLRAWRYYWPNGYSQSDVVETWRSVATILSRADIVIPGHGPPIVVSPSLLTELLVGFPGAEYADQCPDVTAVLARRLEELRSGK